MDYVHGIGSNKAGAWAECYKAYSKWSVSVYKEQPLTFVQSYSLLRNHKPIHVGGSGHSILIVGCVVGEQYNALYFDDPDTGREYVQLYNGTNMNTTFSLPGGYSMSWEESRCPY